MTEKRDRVAILGAGGHGREVAEILRDQMQLGGPEPIGFIDDSILLQGVILDGLPVLGDFSWLSKSGIKVSVICAVGTPKVCKKLAARAAAAGLRFASAISPLAHISSLAVIEEGVCIFPGVVVNTGSRIGSHTTLNLSSSVSHDSIVGSYCNINPGARLAGHVSIEEGCYIGMGASVIQGCCVGGWSVIGAGAVVIGNIASHVTAVGVPAAPVKIKV